MVEVLVPAGAIPADVVTICRELAEHGQRGWIVGGCLRDVLRGRTPSDWDVATTARPEQVQHIFRRVIPTGLDHGTVTVRIGGRSFEVTTLRTEGRYSDGRRPDQVQFVRELKLDLARRDFTVNAIAFDPLAGELFDPFGGVGDLERRVVRTVGDARARFDEDGLRILRAARFVASLEFELDASTRAAMPAALGRFAQVSAERVRGEWLKALSAPTPSRAFEVMRTTGILGITCPELLEQVDCTQNRYHAHDVWTHTMLCVNACPPNPVLRMAALFHDLGKPRARARSAETQDYTFYNHETLGAQMADARLRKLRFSNAERARIVHLIRHHLICYRPEWTDAAVRRFVARVGAECIDELLELAHADALAKGRPVAAEREALESLRQRIREIDRRGEALGLRDLALNGRDVVGALGGRPGPVVGKVLRALLERVLEDPSLNTKSTLLGMINDVRPKED